MLSVPRPNQQHGGRKFNGFTCSQLKVEIAHIGDNTSVRKNDIYATDVSTYYVACKKQYCMYVAVPEIELSDSGSLIQSERCSRYNLLQVTAILLCNV